MFPVYIHEGQFCLSYSNEDRTKFMKRNRNVTQSARRLLLVALVGAALSTGASAESISETIFATVSNVPTHFGGTGSSTGTAAINFSFSSSSVSENVTSSTNEYISGIAPGNITASVTINGVVLSVAANTTTYLNFVDPVSGGSTLFINLHEFTPVSAAIYNASQLIYSTASLPLGSAGITQANFDTWAQGVYLTGPVTLTASDPSGSYSLNLTSVSASTPEPATAATVLLGGVALFLARRRAKATPAVD
jgi:hypothetical protein